MERTQGTFTMQGVSLTALAQQYGTPLYVYDAEKIVGQVSKMKKAFQGVDLTLKFAAKSLTNISILKLIRSTGTLLDVVSIQEALIGMQAGYAPHEIMYTPNCVPFQEIEEAIALGLTINIDNLPFLERFGQRYAQTHPCCVRINPHIRAGGNEKIQVGHKDSKFGISVAQTDEIVALVEKYQIRLNGLHMHTGSDIKEADAFLKGADVLFRTARRFKDLEFIDFGGGFKVSYREDEPEIDLPTLGAQMTKAFQEFCLEYGRPLQMWFEPGKYLVSEAGILLAQATVVKQTPTAQFIGLDTGLNHLIRPMMYNAYHQIVNLSNPGGPSKNYHVVGYICETDTFAWDRPLAETQEGDILAILNAGAYGFSMSSNYNSRFRPAEVLIYQGKAYLVRKREEMEDLLRHQIDVFGNDQRL
jgi:diaminopimelate decarboxylase